MVLTVIVPDKRPGMRRMLRSELESLGVESEVLYSSWANGIRVAQGDYIVLLERDSAISKGSIGRQLESFLNNPRFRKLAMVSPCIEFEDTGSVVFGSFVPASNNQYQRLSRAGSVGGAVIRRSSLLKFMDIFEPKKNHIVDLSYDLSVLFWENGLRVLSDPRSTYYTPSKLKRRQAVAISSNLLELWKRECIA